MLTAFEFLNLLSRTVDVFGKGSNLLVQPLLISVHRRHAAGQHHAQPCAQLIAHGGKPLGLGCLPLEAIHLPRHFFKNVVHASQVLLGALQAQLGQPLLGLETGNARRLFNDRSPVVRLGAEQLPDPLLPDDGVTFRSQAGAHEDVLNVTQSAQLSIQQVLAFAGAKQPPGDHDLTLLRCPLKLSPADLEHHRLRARSLAGRRGGSGFRPLVIERLPGLLGSDNLLCFDRPLPAHLVLVPIGRSVVLHHDLRLHWNWPLIGLRIDHGQRHFRHPQGLAIPGSGENDVLHMRATQGLGALLAEHPAHPVENVGLAASIRPHHHRNPRTRNSQLRPVAEALEAEDMDFL